MKNFVVIMAGGIGSRLWPVSTQQKPKQFQDLMGTGKSLLQLAYERAKLITSDDCIFIVTNTQWVSILKEQLPDMPEACLVVEPLRRNTATATLYALNRIAQREVEAMVSIMPSDHIVLEEQKFTATIQQAAKYCQSHQDLVTIGIKATRPEVNYGYIQYFPDTDKAPIHNIKTFTEKPTAEIANTFLRSGDFLWYSGIKISKLSVLLHAFGTFLPDTAQLFEEVRPYLNSSDEKRLIDKIYPQSEVVPFRQAVLYKMQNVKVIVGHFAWTDITLWGELYDVHEKDYFENAVTGKQVMMYNSSNCLVEIASDKLVLVNGLQGYIIAESPKGLIICPRNKEHEIRSMLHELKRDVADKYL